MFTGVPVRARSDPALAMKASGMSSCEGGSPARAATTTTRGTRAATAPLMLMSADAIATTAPIARRSRARPVPARVITCLPAQAVTPVASSASLTTKSPAMKSTVGSPNPATASGRVSTPLKNSSRETPTAMTAIGTRLLTNATTARARMISVAATGSTRPA